MEKTAKHAENSDGRNRKKTIRTHANIAGD